VRLRDQGQGRDELVCEQQRIIEQLRQAKEALAEQTQENVRLESARQRAHEALGESEVRFKTLADNLAQYQLQQAGKMDAIGQLAGGVAHDFNNLLTVILSNANILAEELTGNRDLHALAEMTRAAAERGVELTNGLLAFARRHALESQIANINEVVAGMDGVLRHALGEQIEIELVEGAGLWQALVDPMQLKSALLNLGLNARDVMPDGGKLTIETGNADIDIGYSEANDGVQPGQYVLVCVSGTGTGISTEIAARAFDPLLPTKEAGKGAGPELSMVNDFVRQSGGQIRIYSELGLGTSFKLYLPRAPVAQEAPEPPEPIRPTMKPSWWSKATLWCATMWSDKTHARI
jgi:signal transduction histidine kinase